MNKMFYVILGCALMNFVWAINYEVPFSQGVALLKAGTNAFWFMGIICLVPFIFLLPRLLFKLKRKEQMSEEKEK